MARLGAYLDPHTCPAEPPPLAAMAERTRSLHEAIDANIRASKCAVLHPDSPTVQLDMFGSSEVIAWQEGKAAFLFMGEGCWSELPPLYARYGTSDTRALILRMRQIENARAVVLADSGMQATALVIDSLMRPGSHAVLMRQVYNKTRTYLEHISGRLGGSVTIVDDGDYATLREAVRPESTLMLCETFTNPLMRAQDPQMLGRIVSEARSVAKGLKLVIDSTIATPWGMKQPLLDVPGVSGVVASGTKALGGQDRDLWGYLATNDVDLANQVMDLTAMRGGILDWRRARAILAGLDHAEHAHARRCESASRVAAFLAAHPRVERAFHPSLADHPDAAVVAAHYARSGSIVSFRVKDADERSTRQLADVLAMTVVMRYATSFDGLATKVNHHKTVSEYFTPADRLARDGFDRLIRLGIGVEEADDLCAALNWMLHHGTSITSERIAEWQRSRRRELGQ
jgi:cystathionine gamma-synthase